MSSELHCSESALRAKSANEQTYLLTLVTARAEFAIIVLLFPNKQKLVLLGRRLIKLAVSRSRVGVLVEQPRTSVLHR